MAQGTRTRSRSRRQAPAGPDLPAQGDLDALKLSPEVAYYLITRGIPLPQPWQVPKWKTPEPRSLPGARFDPERVDKVLKSFGLLRHTQGRLARQPLKPDPWQVAYILAPVFGWVRQNDAGKWVRIAAELYVDVCRKNGKTTLAGGIAIYLTAADGEEGAQVLAAATTEAQAGFCFQPVKQLAQSAPALKGHVKALAKKIIHQRSGSYFAVISSAADAQHGGNVHGAIVDELHVHKTADLVEAIETGTGSRDQPLIVIITTADAGKPNTIYARKRERVEKLANGTLRNVTVYGVIWAADEADDPFAEETQQKANPGFGVSPTKEYLARKAAAARDSPAELASYQRLHLGIRTKQQTRFIPLDVWDRNASMVDETRLIGKVAYGGLDLSRTTDLTALAWLFPDGQGGYDAIWRFWAPTDRLADLDKRTAGNASVWVREGRLKLTPGDVIDYEFIKAQMRTDLGQFKVKEIGYDRWNATQIVTDMTEEGAPMVPIGQGMQSMSPPMKEWLTLLRQGTPERPRFRHSGNPLMRWMIDNLAVAMDASGNVKPDKANAGDNIDGVSATATALARAMVAPKPRRSAYEEDEDGNGGELMVV